MSFWEHLKPAPRTPTPTSVERLRDGEALALHWDDGSIVELPARPLRQSCPCAECVDEWTNKRTFQPETVPEGIRLTEAREVGNYALGLLFSDGHRTGIFTWALLHELSRPAAEG